MSEPVSREAREKQHDDEVFRRLQWRGVEDPCETCGGAGSRPYASTSTWRGGWGGSAITRDVCDSCWGSGDKGRPWVNLRHIYAVLTGEQKRKLAEARRG
jgi:hypothetical protein